MGESPKNQPEQNEAERMKKEMREKLDKTKRIHDTLIAHFNKAFAEGKLIVDKSDPDAKVKVDNQRGEVYTAIFEELEQHGIRFKKPPGTIREMRDYLRSQGYVYIGGTLNIQHPTKKDVILHIFSPTLFKVESSERVSLANYLAGYLKFEEGSTVEVIHTSRNLIEGERNVLEERHGVISRMHGTTERIPGGAAILLRDNIREEAEWKQKKRDGEVDETEIQKIEQQLIADTKVNEIFHLIYHLLFHQYMETPAYKNAAFPFEGKRYSPGDVDELFSNLGTLLYGGSDFMDNLNELIIQDSVETYTLTTVLFRSVAEKVVEMVGGTVEENGKFKLTPEQVPNFTTTYKDEVTRKVIGIVIGLKRALDLKNLKG